MKMRFIKWLNISLRQKLVTVSVICLLVPLLISTIVSNYMAKDVLMDNAISNSQDSMQMVELNLTSLINNLLYITNNVQFDSELNTLLREGKESETKAQHVLNQTRITAKLSSITSLLNDTYITILTDEHGGYTNYSAYDYNYELFYEEDWFKQLKAMNGYETLWLGGQPNYLLSSRPSSSHLITIARKIQFSTRPSGYVIVSMKETDFHESFAKLAGNSQIMLVNSKGIILSHPDSKQIGQRFAYADRIHFQEDDAKVTTIDGEHYLLTSHDLTYSDWSLVNLTRYKEATQKINFIQQTNLFIQISFFSIFLIILVVLVRRLTEPLARLGRVANEIEAGNLSIRAQIVGGNEIAKVGRSFNKMLDRIEIMLNKAVLDQTKKRMLELEMLQAQIHPHFLFNVLNSIRLKILKKNDQENALFIQSLAHLLRMTINRNNEYIPLYQEIEIVTHYIKLMNMRQKQPIMYEAHIPQDAGMVEVPRLFIQPLIENAYIHGFNEGGGTIMISSRVEHQQLIVEVADNGKGMNEEERMRLLDHLQHDGAEEQIEYKRSGFTGIGVKNVYERLRLIYGPAFKLLIESEQGEGTKITLLIPVVAGEARYV
ncbi:HAMP domain-containing protein [Paenibacillus sp. LMG 31461]|uniref:histidine kinase n=1 Tax=Paenibacillus plantarum TaxID=2654975 RepID=A0ABX1XM93_9BACL|nr:sensor histidine kinase [Paenibacillus plantarum]NOU69675.1 HAMP domain-containing protein [Paenibacillus plantarum]